MKSQNPAFRLFLFLLLFGLASLVTIALVLKSPSQILHDEQERKFRQDSISIVREGEADRMQLDAQLWVMDHRLQDIKDSINNAIK